MPIYQVIVLAFVQGLTEFLPVSSSAHLLLAPWLLGWTDPGLTFDIALHFGTLIAVVGYFFKDWIQIITQAFGIHLKGSDPELALNPKLLWLLALGSIPVGIAGYIFKEQAETTWHTPVIAGTMMILIGLVMWAAERVGRKNRDIGSVNVIDASLIGLSQALAIVPGTSRSGITISSGLFRNLDRVAAARFSFLLSTPAIAGAAASAYHHLHKTGGIPPEMKTPFLLGIVVSAAVGAVVIAFFLRFLRHRSLYPFIIYRIVFGIIVLALAFLHPPVG